MKIFTKALFTLLSILGFLCLGVSAQAQFATGSNGPISISADSADNQGNKTVLIGGVDVRQGDTRILADKMELYSASGNLNNNDISKIVATGAFYYITPNQTVRGENAVYTRTNNAFVVTGNVIMKQKDGSVITGEKLFYNLNTKQARVVGSCKGRKCGRKGRVNILIKNTKNANARS